MQAAQQTEVYWMALARDIPFSEYATNDIIRLAAGKTPESGVPRAQNHGPVVLQVVRPTRQGVFLHRSIASRYFSIVHSCSKAHVTANGGRK